MEKAVGIAQLFEKAKEFIDRGVVVADGPKQKVVEALAAGKVGRGA